MTRPPVEVLEGRQLLSQVFTVTDTLDDTNPGSLRWAIGLVNADTTDTAVSPDQIQFNIPTSDPGYNATTGVWTIAPASALPTVLRPVVIDGYTQTGASPNTAVTSDNAVLKIELKSTRSFFADGLTISGGDSTVEGLAIDGFRGAGVRLLGGGNDLVEGNFLGPDPTGTVAGLDDFGVEIQGANNTIGGTTPAARNLLAGNESSDVGIILGASNNLIAGNFVGISASGTAGLPSGGIRIDGGGPGNTIGGTVAGARNVVVGGISSISERSDSAGHTLIEGNYIGTDAAGTSPIVGPLLLSGIQADAPDDTIGGAAAGAGNIISGRPSDGVYVSGDSDLIQGNWIGLSAAGGPLGNGQGGLVVVASHVTIGGASSGAGNVISGNKVGLGISGFGELIQGNRIGTDPTGTSPLPNTSDGIFFDGPGTGGTVGGTGPGEANVIAYNGGAGVNIPGNATGPSGIAILSNSIHDNAKLGIDLGGDGVTPNMPGGPHAGPNHLQNYPVLLAADSSASSTRIIGTLNSTPDSTFTLQFFANLTADPSGFGQGKTYLGQLTGVETDASGNASFTFVAPVAVAGEFLSATATDADGDTSEFAKDIQEGAAAIADLAVTTLPVDVLSNGFINLQFTIADLGPDAAQGVAATIQVPAHTTFQLLAQSSPVFQFQAPPVGGGTGSTITLTTAFLAPNQSVTITLGVLPEPNTAGLPLADTAVVASLTPDPNLANNVATASGTIGIPTTIGLSPSSQHTTFGQVANFYVSSSSSSPIFSPGGGVTFSVDGVPSATVPFTVLGEGLAQAVFSTSTIPAGTHRVTAHYNGDGTYLPSDAGPVILVVDPASTATVLVAQPNPSAVGQPVTFTAGVASSVPGVVPTGGVTFFIDGVGHTTPLTPAAGGHAATATFTFPAFQVGAHQVTAHYNGSPDFTPSASTAVAQVVNRAATVTALAASPSPAAIGHPVTFTAVVAPAPLADGPTGAVTFFVDGVGYTTPLVPSADGLTGTAMFTTTVLGPGLHGAIARYNGDANFAPSQSAEVIASVSPAPPTPRVVEVLRFGYHAMPTALAVVFNTPLDPASSLDLANYQLLGPHRLPIPLASAMLAADGMSVVLHPRGRLNVHWTYTLTVLGKPPVGIRSAAGVYAGTNQVELVTLRNLVPTPKLSGTSRAASRPNPHPHAVDAVLSSGHLHAVAARGRRR